MLAIYKSAILHSMFRGTASAIISVYKNYKSLTKESGNFNLKFLTKKNKKKKNNAHK